MHAFNGALWKQGQVDLCESSLVYRVFQAARASQRDKTSKVRQDNLSYHFYLPIIPLQLFNDLLGTVLNTQRHTTKFSILGKA